MLSNPHPTPHRGPSAAARSSRAHVGSLSETADQRVAEMAEEEEEEFDLNCDEVLSDPEPEYDMHPMNGHVMTDPMLSLRAELAWCVVGCFAPNPLTAAYTSAYTVVHSVGTSSMHAARRSLLILWLPHRHGGIHICFGGRPDQAALSSTNPCIGYPRPQNTFCTHSTKRRA